MSYSALDLKDAFHQVSVHPDHVHKTAVQTPFGLFVYNKMPFGLKNAPPVFQCFIDIILDRVDCAIAYIDDILVFSRTYEDHVRDLEMVLRRLNEYGLVLNVPKSQFSQTPVTFLGLEFDARAFNRLCP